MKYLPWVVVIVIVLAVIYHKRVSAWLDKTMKDESAPASSASLNTPLQNLSLQTTTASKTQSSVDAMIAKLNQAKQDVYAEDLFEDLRNINTGPVLQSDFIRTIRSESDKILGATQEDPNEKLSTGEAASRKREQTWWPNIMYENSPSYLQSFEGCSCGSGYGCNKH